jgi:hypothetical protein
MPHPTRIFKQPQELETAFETYKESLILEAEKWKKVQYVGKDGDRVTDAPMMPLTLDGFEVWYYKTYKHYIGHYFDNKQDLYNDFVAICSHVRKECRANQITGGLLNQFNSSITQRLNGLTEKVEQTNIEKPKFSFDS